MTTDRRDAAETTTSRWVGAPWFVAAGIAAVIAVIMLFTPVSSPTRTGAPDCGYPLRPGGGSEEPAQQTDWCVAGRGSRVSLSVGVLAIGGFLVVPGMLRRSRRELDGRTGGGLALLALASTLLWLPQSDEKTNAWCGSALMPSTPAVLQPRFENDQRLAECAGRRGTRVAWVLIPAVGGVLLLSSRRSAAAPTRWP